ncbi:PREDICTED: protein DEHYDRATION-INDUCED 19 homolog 4 isoform X2 [Camelina sativa]|uniref:Protein DEHYDRATION-INDUCED 19 homolog 4 isoform X2 n=1 Tax=Camelina sativa TaxID=90675 RepID=A0ABM0W187_CAMSA|nr:PREDICTED: protein DEHYDRATION-INDUCED 19 homolog 4 isoform X2 [Camelina sativa]
MDSSNSWINCPSVFSSSSSSSLRRCQSRSGGGVGGGGYEDLEGEDDLKAEFICPFCAEDFDIVGLCCHIDEEHPVEAKNGVCPVCTKRVGLNIVGHITTQHANFFKVQRKRRLRRGGYSSTYLALKKELREANLQSLLGGSSSFTSSTNIDSDPLLSSFMFNSPSLNESANKTATLVVTEEKSATKVSFKESLKRDIQEAPLSGEDQEKAKKSEFVRGMLLSTMLGDDF